MRCISAPVSSRPRTVEPRSWPIARRISSSVRPCGGHLVEFVAADLEDVVHLARAAAGVDAEQAAVGEAGGVRVHAVGQAALLPDLLEEAGAHPAAEGGVEHAQGPAPVVGARQPGMPRTTWACSVLRLSSSTRPAGTDARAPARGAIGRGVRPVAGRRPARRRGGPGGRPWRGRRCRRPRRRGAWGRSASCRSGGCGRRVRALTVSTVPRTGRPSGVSPSMVCANRSCTQSPGSSSVIAISSRMTPRSASTSSASISEPVSMSQTTSMASGRSVSSTRA